MDSYQILKSIHKVGHPLTGKVIGYKQPIDHHGMLIGGEVFLNTSSEYKVVLPYDYLFEERKNFDKTLLPEIGCRIKAVVKNHVDDILYVSSKPSDLEQTEIQKFKEYYKFIEQNKEGRIVKGIVKKIMSFGLFVDIASPFIGLIDIGHSSFNRGKRLSHNNLEWPKEGDRISCIIAYYRFHDRQIGLGWNPNKENDLQHYVKMH